MTTFPSALLTSAALLAAATTATGTSAMAQRLLAADSNRTLYELDLVTAQRTPVVTLAAAIGTPSGLAFDPASGTLYAASASNRALYTIDPSIGAVTLIGPFGDPALNMHGLELDTSTGQLWGASQHDGGIYTIDRLTGAATLLVTTGLGSFTNLGYDSRADVLFATNGFGDTLQRVDRATGALSLVGPLQTSGNPNGLAFHSGTGVLYLIDNSSDQLYAIDTATGRAHVVGPTGAGNLLGLAFVPGGAGSIVRAPHACGSASILAHGSTAPGGLVTVHLGATTGFPFVGFGLQPLAVPFCGCTIGHEWALAFAGPTSNVAIPAVPGLVGVQVGMQGLDLFGAGGCADPAIVLTDSLVLTIG
jgi:hypothetical protein